MSYVASIIAVVTANVRQITPLRGVRHCMCTVAESVTPRQYPIHQTREYRASLDLDPRPAAMCLPQVIDAMASLPGYLAASFNTHRPSVSFILFIASEGKLIMLNSVDAVGL